MTVTQRLLNFSGAIVELESTVTRIHTFENGRTKIILCELGSNVAPPSVLNFSVEMVSDVRFVE